MFLIALYRGPASATTPPAVAACQAGDDHVDDGDDAADDGVQHGSDGVDDGHEAGADGAEDAFDLDGVSSPSRCEVSVEDVRKRRRHPFWQSRTRSCRECCFKV